MWGQAQVSSSKKRGSVSGFSCTETEIGSGKLRKEEAGDIGLFTLFLYFKECYSKHLCLLEMHLAAGEREPTMVTQTNHGLFFLLCPEKNP